MEISGIKISQNIINKLKKLPKPKKILAAILVGKNQASESFLRQKEKVAKRLRIGFKIYRFPQKIKSNVLKQEISKIAKTDSVGGIIVQLPLPKHLDRKSILNSIPENLDIERIFTPPAVGVVKEIIKLKKIKLSKSKVAVVGLGFLVGKPVADWLKGECRKLYLLNKGSDFKILKNADLVISGVGKAGLIKTKILKKNAVIIDFGCSFQNGKIKGDFDAFEFKNLSYTPTPGGTGPILVAKLFENFYLLNIYRVKGKKPKF